jgi:hypothetical protein
MTMRFGRGVLPLFIPLPATVAASFHLLSCVQAVILTVTMVPSVKTVPRIRAAAQP